MKHTAELDTGGHRRPPAAAAPPPPPRRRNPDHPPYAEMVRVALQSLAEDGGSTESAISDYIVSAYPGIPPGHPNLLPYYLRKLVAARELLARPNARYLLPQNPILNPTPSRPIPSPPPRPRDPIRRSRRERWGRYLDGARIPLLPSVQPAETVNGEEPAPKRRLILRLQRAKAADGSGEGDVAAIGWRCLGDGSRGDGASSQPMKMVQEEAGAPMRELPDLLPSSPNEELQPQLEPEMQLSVQVVLEPDDEPRPPAKKAMPFIVVGLPALVDGKPPKIGRSFWPIQALAADSRPMREVPLPASENGASEERQLPPTDNGSRKTEGKSSSLPPPLSVPTPEKHATNNEKLSPPPPQLVATVHHETGELEKESSAEDPAPEKPVKTNEKSLSLPPSLLAPAHHENGEPEEAPSAEQPEPEKPIEEQLLPVQVQLEALTMDEKEISSVQRKKQTRRSKRLWYEH